MLVYCCLYFIFLLHHLPPPSTPQPHPTPIVCLRIQVNPQNKEHFRSVSQESAFGDFLFAHTILHLVVVNYIG